MSVKATIKGKLGIVAIKDIPVVSSREVAEAFEREHRNVLRDIRNLKSDGEEFWLLNFEQRNYKNRGKLYPEFLMTRDGFVILTMGFTGKKAMQFKIAYINEFNRMEEAIKTRIAMRSNYPPLMEAVHDSHDNPQFYHYSNEADLINRIVFGMDAKQYREKYGLKKNESIRDHMTTTERKLVDKLQLVDTGLVEIGMSYEERKKRLTAVYQKKISKLADSCITEAASA